jgi:hypothetical protein
MDPLTLPIGTAIQVIKFVWGGAIAGRELKRASKAIGNVVLVALARALCPENPNSQEVQKATQRIAQRLQEIPIEEDPAPDRLKRLRQRVRSATPSWLRLKGIPPVRQFGKRKFDDLLADWLARALDQDAEVLDLALCHDRPVDREALLSRFPNDFFHAVCDADDSAWKDGLLEAMRKQRRGHEFIEDEKRRRSTRRILAISLTTGAATGVAGGTVAGGSAESVLLSALVGLVLGAAGGVAESRQQPAKPLTEPQIAAREGVKAWLAELARTIPQLERVSAGTASHRFAKDEPPRAADVLDGWVAREQSVVITLNDDLLEDLSGRLKQNAQLAGDAELLAGLIALETAIVGYVRGSLDGQDVVDTLKVMLATLALTEEVDLGASPRPETEPGDE